MKSVHKLSVCTISFQELSVALGTLTNFLSNNHRIESPLLRRGDKFNDSGFCDIVMKAIAVLTENEKRAN